MKKGVWTPKLVWVESRLKTNSTWLPTEASSHGRGRTAQSMESRVQRSDQVPQKLFPGRKAKLSSRTRQPACSRISEWLWNRGCCVPPTAPSPTSAAVTPPCVPIACWDWRFGSLWLWRTGVQIRETTREAVLTEWPLRSLIGTRTRIVSEEPPDRA